MKLCRSVGCLALLAALGACGQRDVILEGQRFDVRTPLIETLPDENGVIPALQSQETAAGVPGLVLPDARNHKSWTHRGGSARHAIRHPRLSATPRRIWSAGIGTGTGRTLRITADPVAAAGRIFTLDARARVMAHDASRGTPIWSADLTPASDRGGDASGGGMAIDGSVLFVTTGFGDLTAFDAASGKRLWRQKLDAVAAGAPTVAGGRVYTVSRNGQAWAVDTANGRIQWTLRGLPGVSVRAGGAGPAITDRLVVFPFGSGELIAALRQSGIRVWSASVSGTRRGRAYAGLNDISADPVVDDGVIYAGNPSGRVVAIDAASGTRLWTATEGAVSPVWPVGSSVFLVSDQNQLVRLDAATGAVIWARSLPLFRNERVRRRKAIFAHYGPILAGGKLWVASDDGLLRSFDPVTGAEAGSIELRGGAASNPIVVDDMMYVVTKLGQLVAYR